MSAWKAIVAALVIFFAGAVSGAMAARLYLSKSVRQPPPPFPGGPHMPSTSQRMEFLRRIGSKLDLTPQQQERINLLVNESQQRMKALWEPVAPQAQEEMRQLRKKIEAELTSEQRERYDKLLKERPFRKPGEQPSSRRREGRGESQAERPWPSAAGGPAPAPRGGGDAPVPAPPTPAPPPR